METGASVEAEVGNSERVDKHCDSLTASQKGFAHLLLDWIKNPRNMVLLISGGPGTGKTYAVTKTLDLVQSTQLRMALTARIALKIKGRTIHSCLNLPWGAGTVLDSVETELAEETDFEKCLEKSKVLQKVFHCDETPTFVVVDEIGMVPFWLSYQIIFYFFKKSKKPILFIAMGDSHQLRPVRSINNLFGLSSLDDSFETHRLIFTESKRFDSDYKKVIEGLRVFVATNDEVGLFQFIRKHFNVVEYMTSSLLRKCTLALAFKNATVDYYNKYYLTHMCGGNKVLRLHKLNFETEKKNPSGREFVDVKPGCKIFVTENHCSSVTNGTPLVFERYFPDFDSIGCTDPTTQTNVFVKRNKKGAFPIALGFAGTVHKFQGDTIDDQAIVVSFDESTDLNLVYTALSRVRSQKQILAITL